MSALSSLARSGNTSSGNLRDSSESNSHDRPEDCAVLPDKKDDQTGALFDALLHYLVMNDGHYYGKKYSYEVDGDAIKITTEKTQLYSKHVFTREWLKKSSITKSVFHELCEVAGFKDCEY